MAGRPVYRIYGSGFSVHSCQQDALIPFASSRLAEITLAKVLANYSLVTDSVSYILHLNLLAQA